MDRLGSRTILSYKYMTGMAVYRAGRMPPMQSTEQKRLQAYRYFASRIPKKLDW